MPLTESWMGNEAAETRTGGTTGKGIAKAIDFFVLILYPTS